MLTVVSEVRTASIMRAMIVSLKMEAVRTSETSVNIYLTTWQYIPEDSELHTRRRENLKSHKFTWDSNIHQIFHLRPSLAMMMMIIIIIY
jgi:hypothetical protein